MALLDSGNSWGTCISTNLMKSLGFTQETLIPSRSEVATAKKDDTIKCIGKIPIPLTMQITNHKGETVTNKVQPHVMTDLATDLNISGPFMQMKKWDLLLSKASVVINSKTFKLINPQKFVPKAKLMLLERRVLKPHSIAFVKATLDRKPPPSQLHMPIIAKASPSFYKDKPLLKQIPSIVYTDQHGICQLAVYNETDQDVTVDIEHFGTATYASTDDKPSKKALCQIHPKDIPFTKANVKAKQKYEQLPVAPTEEIFKWPEDKKKQWLIKQFAIDDNEVLSTPDLKQRAGELLLKHFNLFSVDGSYGHTDLIEHRIITNEKAPIKQKPRPINPLLLDDLKTQLEKWISSGIVEPSYSPWAANLVPVKKKSGKIRWCVDFRHLNQVTIKDSFPMPSVMHTLNKLAGSKIFSSLDLEGAFHCVTINKEERAKTAFITPFGLYHMVRLGFGLTNGPATYCRLVDLVLENIPEDMAVSFLDDGIAHSIDVHSHFTALDKMLEAYAKSGLKINPAKCQLFKKEVEYLGHIVNERGIRPPPEFTSSVRNWSLPENKQQIRSFLGMANYYRNHIKDFAEMTKPWNNALAGTNSTKNSKIVITPEMEQSFHRLKKALISPPILGFPYFRGAKAGTFKLDTDFSKYQIAGILSQDQEGQEVVIAYGSKALNKAQQNYASTKGELFAGTYFMKKFALYLKWIPHFTWRTDNSALKWLQTMESPPAMIQRWREIQKDYNFTVEHRAGRLHTNADALSRASAPEPADPITGDDEGFISDMEDEEPPLPEPALQMLQVNLNIQQDIELQNQIGPKTLAQIKNAMNHVLQNLPGNQQQDDSLKLVYNWIKGGPKPNKMEKKGLTVEQSKFLGSLPQISIKEDVLHWTHPDNGPFTGRQVPLIPDNLKSVMIKYAHLMTGHMALEKTFDVLSKVCYFYAMKKHIKDFIQTCAPCQTKQRANRAQKHTLASNKSAYPFQRIHVDFVGPIAKSKKGNQWLFTVKDAFSKWVEAFPLKSATAAAAANCLERDIFTRFGLPEQIHSDCGAQFTSTFWQDMGRALQMKISYTTPANPKANGQVERMHRDLQNILKATNKGTISNWEDALPAALLALRTTRSEATNLSPYQIIFGREPTLPIDLIFGIEKDPDESTDPDKMKARIQRAHHFARTNLDRSVERQRRAYQADKQYFYPGQQVLLYTNNQGTGPRKFKSFWTGPWTICAPPINEVMVRLAPNPGWKIKDSIVVSIDRIKLYTGIETRQPSESDDLYMTGDEFAELIHQEPAYIN